MNKLAALLALALVGCAAPSGPFAAISEGSRMDDGGGECGAVALDENHALTAAHCLSDGALYFAPGESGGRAFHVAGVDRKRDIACLVVETGEAGHVVGDLYEGSALTAESNVSGVVEGRAGEGWTVDMPSQQGDSGSAVFSEDGSLVGLILGSAESGVTSTLRTRLGSARQAADLCVTR